MVSLKMIALSIGVTTGLISCEETPSRTTFPNVDVISRTTLDVDIQPQEETCYGPFFEYPCYRGITEAGEDVLFYSLVEGYEHKVGTSARLTIEKVVYNPSDIDFPQDVSGVEYFLIKHH